MDIGFNGKITGGTRPATFSQPKIANISSFLEQRKRLVAEHWNTVAQIGGMIASSGQAAGNIMSTMDAKREQRVENDYRTDFSTMKMKYANGLNQINDQLAQQDFEDPEDYRLAWQEKSRALWFALRDDADKNGTFRRWNKWGESDRLKKDMELVSLAAEEQAANSWMSGWKRRQRQAVESNAQDAIALGITDYDQFLAIYQRDATMTPSEMKLAATQATKKSTINAATNMISSVAASTYTQAFWDNQNQLLRTGQYDQVEKNKEEADKKIDEAVNNARELIAKGFSPFIQPGSAENLEEERAMELSLKQGDVAQAGAKEAGESVKNSAQWRATQKEIATQKEARRKEEQAKADALWNIINIGKKSKQAASATDREMKTKYNIDTAKELAKWRETGEAPTSDLGLAVVSLAPDGTEGQDYATDTEENVDGYGSKRVHTRRFVFFQSDDPNLSPEENAMRSRVMLTSAVLDEIYSYSDASPNGIQNMLDLFAELKPLLSPVQYKSLWDEWMSQIGVDKSKTVNVAYRNQEFDNMKQEILAAAGYDVDNEKELNKAWQEFAFKNQDVNTAFETWRSSVGKAKTNEAVLASVAGIKTQLLDLATKKKEVRDTASLVSQILRQDFSTDQGGALLGVVGDSELRETDAAIRAREAKEAEAKRAKKEAAFARHKKSVGQVGAFAMTRAEEKGYVGNVFTGKVGAGWFVDNELVKEFAKTKAGEKWFLSQLRGDASPRRLADIDAILAREDTKEMMRRVIEEDKEHQARKNNE